MLSPEPRESVNIFNESSATESDLQNWRQTSHPIDDYNSNQRYLTRHLPMSKIVTLRGKPKFIVMSDADSSSLGLSDEEDIEELRMFHEPKRFQNSLDLINEGILDV